MKALVRVKVKRIKSICGECKEICPLFPTNRGNEIRKFDLVECNCFGDLKLEYKDTGLPWCDTCNGHNAHHTLCPECANRLVFERE